jgi:hypothetical protein
VPKQYRFVARVLPDERQSCARCNTGNLRIARRGLAQFVAVEHDELRRVDSLAFAPAFRKPLHRALDDGEGVTATWLQHDRVEMHCKLGLLGQTTKERDIATLAISFAPYKDWGALGPKGATAPHPICGTAP